MNEDPWSWLLGKTAEGDWRLGRPGASSRPVPEADPKVLLVRRVIPHPRPVLARFIAAVAAADSERRLRWICHRSPHRPQRRYWFLFFIEDRPGEEEPRYLFGLELVSRQSLNLWFFSGFREPNHLNASFLEDYEGDSQRRLPRFCLDPTTELPIEEWIKQATRGELLFSWGFEESSTDIGQTRLCDLSELVVESLAAEIQSETASPRARARIVLIEPDRRELFALHEARVTFGRHRSSSIISRHPSVSARHAVIEVDEDGASLFDLESLNGSFINKHLCRPKERRAIPEVAFLEFGAVQMLFTQARPEARLGEQETAFIESLMRSGRLSHTAYTKCAEEALAQGISRGERLVLSELIAAEDWVRGRLGDQAFPQRNWLAAGAMILLGLTVIMLLSWWWTWG